jgi:hypothetical protein
LNACLFCTFSVIWLRMNFLNVLLEMEIKIDLRVDYYWGNVNGSISANWGSFHALYFSSQKFTNSINSPPSMGIRLYGDECSNTFFGIKILKETKAIK